MHRKRCVSHLLLMLKKSLPKLIDWKECFICQGRSNAESILVKPHSRPGNNYIAFYSVSDAYFDFLYKHTHPRKNTHTLLTNTWTPFSVRHLKFDHLRIALIIGLCGGLNWEGTPNQGVGLLITFLGDAGCYPVHKNCLKKSLRPSIHLCTQSSCKCVRTCVRAYVHACMHACV